MQILLGTWIPRSTTSYDFMVGFRVVSWRSVLQPRLPLSTMEAEYLAAAAAAREALRLHCW
jgi:hypothetical protein